MQINETHKQTAGVGHPYNMRTCDICPTEFRPKSPQHRHCSRRCAYIAVKLNREAAKDMDRDVAIEFYGSQYDDPLRHVRRGRTKQLIRHVVNYCRKHNTIHITQGEIAEYSGLKLRDKEMEMAAESVPALTFFANRIVDGGRLVAVWQFVEDDLITNADARARNVQRYPKR